MTDAPDSSPSRRLRPRTVAMAIVLAITCIVAWFIIDIRRTLTDMPAPDDPSRAALTELCATAQPPGENGWPALAVLLGQCADATDAAEAAVPEDAPWEAVERAETAAIVALLDDPTWSRDLDGALMQPRFVRPWITSNGLLLNEELRLTRPARALGRALAAHAHRAADRGAWRDAVASLHRLHRLGTSMAHQSTVIHALIGLGMQRDALAVMRTMVHAGDVSPEIVAALRDLVARIDDPAMARFIERERLAVHNALHWTHGAHGRVLPLTTLLDRDVLSNGLTIMHPIDPVHDDRSITLALIARWGLATHDETAALTDRYFAALTTQIDVPFAARWTQWPAPELLTDLEAPRHTVLAAFLPALDRLVDIGDAFVADRRATRILLALESHRAAHGAFPESLDELVPDSLDALPTDPISGGAFGYRRVTTPEGAPTYELYSTGPDGTDAGAFLRSDETPATYRVSDGADIRFTPAHTLDDADTPE